MCEDHCSDSSFFSLLASQLCQRLVKALPAAKFSADSLNHLKSFINSAIEHASKTLPNQWESDDHAQVLGAVRDLLDFSAPPLTVIQAAGLLQHDEASQHWAVTAFALPQGKKLIESAVANAKSKESLADVLSTLHSAETQLTASGLCAIDAPFLASLKGCFDSEHGKLISKIFQDLSDKKMKSLKGDDRERQRSWRWRLTSATSSCRF